MMKQIEWDALIQTIQSGDCILMLGPEIPIDNNNGNPEQSLMKILEKELSEQLVAELNTKYPEAKYTHETLRCFNINELATRYEKEFTKAILNNSVASFLKKKNNVRSQIYKKLASLPFQFIINTTPDEIYIENLKAMGKEPSKDFYNYEGAIEPMVEDISAETIEDKSRLGSIAKPFVYYLYGALDDPKSLVITENDLLDFLIKVISKSPPLPRNISSQFKNKHKCFLFLGFRFLSKNWYFRILLHVLIADRKCDRSFVLEDISRLDAEKSHPIIFFENEFKIKFIDMELRSFVEELKWRYEQCKEELLEVPTQPSYTKPKVFISHTEEDSEYARKLFNLFKERNLEPWFDKKNLRGGDLWDSVIEETIKEMDAFVLLQSKSLIKKVVGYINKEINLADNRASYFRDEQGVKFFFSVKIDKEPKTLKRIQKYQSIDLTIEGNLEKLITEIKMSYQRRLKYQSRQ